MQTARDLIRQLLCCMAAPASPATPRIADQIGSWGYVALTVDSLGPRGIANHCGGGPFLDQVFDAYAALRYLAQ